MAVVRNLRSDPYRARRVLVVEDNLDSVHAMATLIKMMGHQCQFAINGFAALDIARSFRPEVILLDMGLPDCQGYEVARQLKWEPGFEATRIIAVTGMPNEQELRERAREAGIEEFYCKPLDLAALEELLAGGSVPEARGSL